MEDARRTEAEDDPAPIKTVLMIATRAISTFMRRKFL